MTFDQFKKEVSFFYPVFLLEKTVSHNTRRIILRVTLILLLVSFILASGIVTEPSTAMTGVFFLFLVVAIKFAALDALFFSYLFDSRNRDGLFALSVIIFNSNKKDVTRGFVLSRSGRETLRRAGIDEEALDLFLSQRKNKVSSEDIQGNGSAPLAKSYIRALLSADKEFETFLELHDVTESVLWGSFAWAVELLHDELTRERFWSRASLDTYEPIGSGWAYGEAYVLQKYSSPLSYSLQEAIELHEEEIKTLEVALTKSSEANALIVGEEGSGKMEIIEGLARKIHRNDVNATLRKKKILVLSVDTLLAGSADASHLEKTLITIFNEVSKAGNLVVVIPNLGTLIVGAERLKVDVVSILVPFMRSPLIHVIGVSDPETFHSILAKNNDLMQFVSTILVKGSSSEVVTSILMDEVRELERTQGIFVTYPAIKTAVESSQQYFVSAPLYDTSFDLLLESIGVVDLEKRTLILPSDVLNVVKRKTGVETGGISEKERDRLTHLEDLLHARVIGQLPAIKLVSDAFRRARSGISDPGRPLGSFLFLGPTGVGKTETAKALTEIFFGEKGKMQRLDMSEYDTPDALSRLIGGYDNEEPGVLASMIRDNPYGVLLLDEFEKTNSKALDLFLQIIDEGIFSDAQGKKISARNLIIVATSNAGSQIIFNAVSKGENLLSSKDSIVDSIIEQGIFKPELINRFDGVVLFEPLDSQSLRKIAELMLARLTWRLKEKGMTLNVNNALLDFLVRKGSDPKFGARPLNRAIQDTVEKIIADGIISQKWKSGSTIEIAKTDLVE